MKRALIVAISISLIAQMQCEARSRALGVAASIETTRAMLNSDMDGVFVSPKGDKYVVMLIRGDVQSDGLWVELRSGQLDSLDHAEPRLVTRLFTRGLGSHAGFGQIIGSPILTQPWVNVPRWIDDDRVAFLWEDASGTVQILSIEAMTGEPTFLTASDSHVMAFVTSTSGTLLYDALVPYPEARSKQMLHDGFTVTGTDVIPYLSGIVDGASAIDFGMCERFVVKEQSAKARRLGNESRVLCGASLLAGSARSAEVISPDGRWAVVDAYVERVPSSWADYRNAELSSLLRQHAANSKSLSATGVNRLMLVDVSHGTVRPIWDAPVISSTSTRIQWSPDSRSVLLLPTFTPASGARAEGLTGNAVADVEVETSKFKLVPIADEVLKRVSDVRWSATNRLEFELQERKVLRFQRDGGVWRLDVRPPRRITSGAWSAVPSGQRIQVQLRQDIATAPALYAIDERGKREKLLLDLNPQLKEVSLGQVRMIEWTDDDGLAWEGRLYFPVNYSPDAKYPTVVQTHGYAGRDEFSLYGPGRGAPALGPGWSVYLAQVLANHGFAVLQMGGPVVGFGVDGISALERGRKGIESAVRRLSSDGIADEARVGIMGHSGTGRLVEHAITQSSIHFAAAIAGDYADANYLQAALYGWPAFSADLNGADPFGPGLTRWLSTAPAFNTAKVTTPLQLQVTSASRGFETILWNWEIFSRLRHEKKAVEFFVVPDIQHGSHILQNPRQLLILQQRALDWWRFWLQNEESSEIAKREQYQAWRSLRELHARSASASASVRPDIEP